MKYRCVCIVLMMIAVPVFGQDGFTQYKHTNGKVSSEGYLVNGKPEGWWKTYYDDGIVRSEGNRKRFLLDSTWRFFAPDGKLMTEITYASDKKNGPQRKFDSQGALISVEPFIDDVRQGEAEYYHANGAVHKRIPFEMGYEQGRGYEFDEDGRLVSLLTYGSGVLRKKEDINRTDARGLKQGPWKEFHPGSAPGRIGKVKWEGTFVDDKRHGVFKEYDALGNLKDITKYDQGEIEKNAAEAEVLKIKSTYHSTGKVATTGTYGKDGSKQGLFREFAPDGSVVSSSIFRNGQLMGKGPVNEMGVPNGNWQEFYLSGELRAEGEYKEGKREGEWVYYHRSGKVEQKGRYANGLAQNQWIWFYQNGAMHREENYRKGREDGSSIEYDSTGAVITQGEYIDGLKEGEWTYVVGDHTEKGKYKDGLKDGIWKHTYQSGRTYFIGEFIGGEPQGKHRWYYPNGQLRTEGKYAAGLQQGDWDLYTEAGELKMTIRYLNGEEVRIDGQKLPVPGGGEPEQ